MQVYCKDCDKVLLITEIEFSEALVNMIKNQVVNEIQVNHRGHYLILDLSTDKLLLTEKLKRAKIYFNNEKVKERLKAKDNLKDSK